MHNFWASAQVEYIIIIIIIFFNDVNDKQCKVNLFTLGLYTR